MDPVSGMDLGIKIREALGFPSKGVRNIVLHLDVLEAAWVQIDRFVTREEGERIVMLLSEEQFDLVKRAEPVESAPWPVEPV